MVHRTVDYVAVAVVARAKNEKMMEVMTKVMMKIDA